MATLLSLAQDIADDTSLQRPGSVIGNTNQTARRILQAVTRTCEELKDRHAWPRLIREHSITTANGTASYALPSDWDRYVSDTAWDSTNYWEMRGSLTPEEWQFRQNAIVAVTTFRKTFRVVWDNSNTALRIFIHPTPAAVETLVLEYITNQWCESSGGSGQSSFQADTDVARVPDELIRLGAKWRILRTGGFAYLDEKAEYESRTDLRIAQSAPSRTIDLGQKPEFFYNLPEGNIGL